MWTALFTTLYALPRAARLLLAHRPALLLTNGPGTCLPLLLVAAALRFLGLGAPTRVAYVESAARVTSLSLCGRMALRLRLVDRFLVQWPGLAARCPGTAFAGRVY